MSDDGSIPKSIELLMKAAGIIQAVFSPIKTLKLVAGAVVAAGGYVGSKIVGKIGKTANKVATKVETKISKAQTKVKEKPTPKLIKSIKNLFKPKEASEKPMVIGNPIRVVDPADNLPPKPREKTLTSTQRY